MSEKKVNAIDVRNVTKIYTSGNAQTKALKNANLTIYDNEFFTKKIWLHCLVLLAVVRLHYYVLLQVLKILLRAQSICFNQEIVNLPPNKRPVNTVFQQYSLFPHLNVFRKCSFWS